MRETGGRTGGTPLSIGVTFSDRIEALLDGRVAIDGREAALRIVEPQALFRSVLRDRAFDVAELSFASHIAAVGAGRRDYVALPVFLSRSFRHSDLYVRTDAGIARPEDLAGRAIGVIDHQQTAALWVRGLLADEHGVARESIRWVAAGLHAPVTTDRAPGPPPPGVDLRRSSETLDAMLADRRIDAVISPAAPRCFTRRVAPVDRMWPDYRRAEQDWWRRRGLFPVMHVLVVRRVLLEADPSLGDRIFAAFDAARRLAVADLAARNFPKVALPWLFDLAAEAEALLGGDAWAYGLDANRPVIETALRHAAADGLTAGVLEPAALFS